MRHPRFAAVMLGALIGLPALDTDALAQAWVPARGEGSVSIAFQDMKVTKHLASTVSVEAGNIDTSVLLADVTFGLTDRMAIDVAVPLVSSKYTGPFPHAGTDIDDGSYRTSFSDVRFAVRYNLVREGAVITPYVGSVVPSSNYAYYGHAAPGQQLNELQVGVYAAKLFERGLPGLFVSGRYGFGFVEKVLDISHNRSLGNLEVGYFFNSRFRAFTMANAGLTHGGIDFPINGSPGLPVEYRPIHDQIQRVNYLEVGLGGAFSMTDSLDVFGSYSSQVAGRNGHSMDRGITVGLSWGFRRKAPGESAAATAPPTGAPDPETEKREGTLLRCICQKS
jgi:hypothetical protein